LTNELGLMSSGIALRRFGRRELSMKRNTENDPEKEKRSYVPPHHGITL
jgi:hypothetical protein